MTGNRWKKYLALFLWATAFALSFRWFLVEDYRIFSHSMAPQLISGDWILVSKSRYGLRLPFSTYEILRFRTPKPGEIVVFALPEKAWAIYVKRVVAVEGDEVHIKGGILHVNGAPATVPTEDKSAGQASERLQGASVEYSISWDKERIPDYGPVQVPEGHFFALGDNRVESVDSRSWGPVPYTCLRGKVSMIWMSLDSSGLRTDRIGRWVRS